MNAKKRIAGIFTELAEALETGRMGRRLAVGVTTLGSEHGVTEVVRGAEMAARHDPNLEVVLIGPRVSSPLRQEECDTEDAAHRRMEELLNEGRILAAVTMHYPFPVGVATVGRILTPARGKAMLLATTTGTSAADRVAALVKNAVYGLAVAKALGLKEPTLGILNVDGARQAERRLKELAARGYPIAFAETVRAEKSAIMRGNDLLAGSPDVMICDTLTGNLLMKIFSAYTTGGSYEAVGYGYGPGVGPGWKRIVNIVSRASGAPVIAGAIAFAAACAAAGLPEILAAEWEAARRAGIEELLAYPVQADEKGEVKPPPAKPTGAEIGGVDVLVIEDAARELWRHGIYAETGMGCEGPVILVAPEDKEEALRLLHGGGYL
ncbi:MAG: glycine/sarcosine/betaine reductase complex component subunit alpha [Bacillota bacterium]|nr:glycine/sarcosine/betaine reductase complex component subunit alpha [Bacillota bacterium]